MAFLDKLNDIAKNIGDKTGDAIETTKLTAKINSEKAAIDNDFRRIGEFYYNAFISGMQVDPELAEVFESARAHFEAIAAAQDEIQKIKTENTAAAPPPAYDAPAQSGAPAGRFCTSPLGVKTNTSSSNISIFREWIYSSASAPS